MPSQQFMDEINTLWNSVKEALKETYSETFVSLWFGDLEILSFEDAADEKIPASPQEESGFILTMGVPSEIKFKTVKRYLPKLQDEFLRLLGATVTIRLQFIGKPVTSEQVKANILGLSTVEKMTEEKDTDTSSFFDYSFEYTFDNFIVGNTNKFAHAACMAVAQHPAKNYNPLFIYGNSGLGKTHLMYATINYMKQHNPNIKIIYTKGEDFTNQMIASLANKKMEDFRKKYRKCDVLLVDDIQFIAGKISTQEEFFHTFNDLFERKKQIILTSDRPPCDIERLEDRLLTRFEWDLLADVQPPDLELRIAIIKKKAEQVNVTIPDNVLTFLGENLRSNIRQIEGAIKKLGALSFLHGKQINMELAHECIAELLGGAEPVSVTVDKIFNAIQKKYGISRENLVSSKRNKEIAAPRHITVYLIKELTDMSYPSIAKIFERDHSTIISSYNLVSSRVLSEPVYAAEINDIKKEISG